VASVSEAKEDQLAAGQVDADAKLALDNAQSMLNERGVEIVRKPGFNLIHNLSQNVQSMLAKEHTSIALFVRHIA
jgi:hypothetical protein